MQAIAKKRAWERGCVILAQVFWYRWRKQGSDAAPVLPCI